MLNTMRISEGDNLIVALSNLKHGQTIDTPVGQIRIVDDVPDVEATTDVAECGATLIIFSTGLRTPSSVPIKPVVETAANTS